MYSYYHSYLDSYCKLHCITFSNTPVPQQPRLLHHLDVSAGDRKRTLAGEFVYSIVASGLLLTEDQSVCHAHFAQYASHMPADQ